MYEKLSQDLQDFEALLTRTLRHATQTLAGIDRRAVALGPARVAPQPLAEQGAGFGGALDEFAARWAPAIWAS